MYYHKILIQILSSICFLLITGCAATYAPVDWLPATENVHQEVYGGWMTLITMPDSLNPNEKWMQYSGEFISSDEENVYLLYDSLYLVPKSKIFGSTLELDKKSAVEYGLWTAGGAVSTISNGKFLLITAPLWLLGGIPTAVGESSRDRYDAENPDNEYWENVKKFSRFPQGIEGIDLTNIKPKMNIKGG